MLLNVCFCWQRLFFIFQAIIKTNTELAKACEKNHGKIVVMQKNNL